MNAVVGRVIAVIVQRTPSGRQAPKTKIKPFFQLTEIQRERLIKVNREKKKYKTLPSIVTRVIFFFYPVLTKSFSFTICSLIKQ